MIACTAVAIGAVLWFGGARSSGQSAGYQAPRTPDGKPNLNGIWQAVNTANWDIQDHPARQGPTVSLGAAFRQASGSSRETKSRTSLKRWQKKRANAANWMTLDPEVKCFLPGIPRATYQGYPFQIVQSPSNVLMAYEFANAAA